MWRLIRWTNLAALGPASFLERRGAERLQFPLRFEQPRQPSNVVGPPFAGTANAAQLRLGRMSLCSARSMPPLRPRDRYSTPAQAAQHTGYQPVHAVNPPLDGGLRSRQQGTRARGWERPGHCKVWGYATRSSQAAAGESSFNTRMPGNTVTEIKSCTARGCVM